MKKIIFGIFVLVMAVQISSAATTKEIEAFFQQGLYFAKGQVVDKAIEQFEKVVSADTSGLEKEYVVETFSEAYFNIGLLRSMQEDIQQAKKAYKQALEIFPDHKRALYFLAYSLTQEGEIAEARYYYSKVKALGYTADPFLGSVLGEVLGQFEEREMIVDYQSLEEGRVKVHVKGNPGGDEQLIRDAIAAVDRVNMIAGKKMFSKAQVEYVRNREEGKKIIEKWVVGSGENESVYWVEYDLAPPKGLPYKVMIMASEDEP